MFERHLLAALLLLSATSLIAQDWNQWRGPSRTGIASSFRPPAKWPDRPTQVWKVPAGLGHSSPVVAENRVFLHSRIEEQEVVAAFNAGDGKPVWNQRYEAPYQVNPAARSHGKGPKSTPIVDGGRLFTYGISGILSAWDANTGRLLWRKDFQKDFRGTSPEFGTAMSPAVADGMLIVHAGGGENGAIMALEPATGSAKWTWKGDGPAYSSPLIADIGGTRQIVAQSRRHVVGLRLSDGRLLWEIPFTTEYDQNIVTPVVSNDLVIYSGIGQPLVAVRPGLKGEKWVTTRVWQNADLPMYMSSPVLYRGHLYGLSQRNRGQFFCVDVKTGTALWTTRGREGENAAVIVAGDHLLTTTTEGELVIARANPKAFEPVRRYTVAESPIWAHPVPTGAGILIKDEATLALWRF